MLFFLKKIRGNHYCHRPLLSAISYNMTWSPNARFLKVLGIALALRVLVAQFAGLKCWQIYFQHLDRIFRSAWQSRDLWYLFCELLFWLRQIPALIINCAELCISPLSRKWTMKLLKPMKILMATFLLDPSHSNRSTCLASGRQQQEYQGRCQWTCFRCGRINLAQQTQRAQSKAIKSSSWQLLSKLETKEIAKHARLMQSLHFPLTPADIHLEAEQILHAWNDNARRDLTTLGPGWYSKVFLVNNPKMKSKCGKGYDKNWALSASHNQLKTWYNEVHCLPPLHYSIFTHLYSILGWWVQISVKHQPRVWLEFRWERFPFSWVVLMHT